MTSKASALELAVLGLLHDSPLHGYELRKRLNLLFGWTRVLSYGSLYPALQRLESKGWIAAEWGTSENNRQARFYSLTRAGRKQLEHDSSEWRRFAAAMARIVEA